MQKQWRTSFENIGSSSYLAVTLPAEIPVVGYQLEMITSNEISHFLPAARRMINGETAVYYNISSKIQLSQILERRKLTRKELTCLIQGAVEAIQEGAEYQLPESGLVMEADSIYVIPDTCSPSFVYIPAECEKGGGLKELLLSMIMHGQIEMSNDNFIQVLLETLNRENLSYQELSACLESGGGNSRMSGSPNDGGQKGFSGGNVYGGGTSRSGFSGESAYGGYASGSGQDGFSGGGVYGGYASRSSQNGFSGGAQPGFSSQGSLAGFPYGGSQAGFPNEGWNGQISPEQQMGGNGGTASQNPAADFEELTEEKPSGKKKKGNKKKEEKAKGGGKGADLLQTAKTADTDEDGFDREKAKKKFMLPQAIVLVAMAALVSFGAFTDESGAIVLNNILAVVLIVAVAEVVLYREVYVNSRSKSENKGSGKSSAKGSSKGSSKNAGKKTGAAVSGTGAKPSGRPAAPSRKPAVPGKASVSGSSSMAENPPMPENPSVSGNQFASGNASVSGNGPMPGGASASGNRPMPSGTPGAAGAMWQSAAPSPVSFAAPSPGDTIPADMGGDTELWDGDSGTEAYLEYYVNGVMSRVVLNKPSTLIGRLSSQVDFAVSNPKVGKIHAEFLNQGGKIYVKDLNSKNGTYINRNGQRLNSNVPYPLADNDRISLADSEFTLRCGSR